MKITTNNQARELKSFYEFSPKQQQQIRSDFDWLEDVESDCGFFEYHGTIHHLQNFMRIRRGEETDSRALAGWDGYESDSYFSGTLVRLLSDGDSVVAGRYVAP